MVIALHPLHCRFQIDFGFPFDQSPSQPTRISIRCGWMNVYDTQMTWCKITLYSIRIGSRVFGIRIRFSAKRNRLNFIRCRCPMHTSVSTETKHFITCCVLHWNCHAAWTSDCIRMIVTSAKFKSKAVSCAISSEGICWMHSFNVPIAVSHHTGNVKYVFGPNPIWLEENFKLPQMLLVGTNNRDCKWYNPISQ